MKLNNIVIAAIATIPASCVAFAPSNSMATMGKVSPTFANVDTTRLFMAEEVRDIIGIIIIRHTDGVLFIAFQDMGIDYDWKE